MKADYLMRTTRYPYRNDLGELEGWATHNYAHWIDSLYRVVGMQHPRQPSGSKWWEIADQ